MKWSRLAIILLMLGVLGITAAGCDGFSPPSAPKASVSGVVFSNQNTGIWVNGEGKITVTPDLAILSLGVQAQEDTVAQAQQKAAAAMDAVSKALTDIGIARKDIQTRQFSIQPLRRWVPETQQEVLIGYRVTNTVTVKVRDIESTGPVIDAVTTAGGDNIIINSIDFTVEDPSTYNEQVRKLAMADAQAKAKQLADLGGVRLGKPTYINESGGYAPPPIIYRAAAGPVPAPAPALVTSVSPGELEVRLDVQAVYSIE